MKQRFGLTLVFMATRTGLTRWQDISVNSENEEENDTPHFSEVHNRAIDETWYKRAVEQYLIDPQSFVYSVPFESGDQPDPLVTASHAIFHSEASRQAPAAVVGFQFHHSALHTRFMNITSSCDNNPCEKTCADSDLDCYILDNNGYVIVSENRSHTGTFFGEIYGGIMNKLVDDNVYRRVRIYDYQGVCFTAEESEPSTSTRLSGPLKYFIWTFETVLAQFIKTIFETQFYWLLSTAYSLSEEGEYYQQYEDNNVEPPQPDANIKPGERIFGKVMINRTRPQPCDLEIGLYLLEPDKKRKYNMGPNGCRSYEVHNVPYSNLVMVVVNTLCPISKDLSSFKLSVLPEEINYNMSHTCYKAKMNKLPRKRPKECIKNHPKEEEIELCGRAATSKLSNILVVSLILKSILKFLYW